MNSFPADFNSSLTGFGGDPAKSQAQHRADIRKTPVVLVHGNASHSADPTFGMLRMKAFLKAHNYRDCEIWAMDYLGENNTSAILVNVHVDHIDRLRLFIDKVREYLGVRKLDFIAHSLGCSMLNGYLRGLQSDERWDYDDHRFDSAGTCVSLAGALSGLGPVGIDEFRTGSEFERNAHLFKVPGGDGVVVDDTPFGASDVAQQLAPERRWAAASAVDNDAVHYVALVARNDFVDRQHPDTGFQRGADLNKAFDLGPSIRGHEAIVKTQGVFDTFKAYLDRNPPKPAVTVALDKANGSYAAPLTVTAAVAPPDTIIGYAARRLTSAIEAGVLVRTAAGTRNGQLTDGSSLSLDTEGAWELALMVAGAPALQRNYGVGVTLPEVTILTDNATPFRNHLQVEAGTSKGRLYFSLDGNFWNAGGNVSLSDSSKVYFIAIDSDGLASATASRFFEKYSPQAVTATLLEHFLAGRLTAQKFMALYLQFGSNAAVALFLVNGKWVLDSETPEASLLPPVVEAALQGGAGPAALTVALRARHPVDPAPRIYYSLDGSLPAEESPYFRSAGLLQLDPAERTTVRYRARDASGNWSEPGEHAYTPAGAAAAPRIVADRAGGDYAGDFEAVVSALDEAGAALTVYYTRDGSDPGDARNPNRRSFTGSERFAIAGNGNHALHCYARSAAGREVWQPFAWSIDDQSGPDTAIAPAMGGRYAGKATVTLEPSAACAWTKYTTDGSEPSESNGELYRGSFALTESAVLKFRSKDLQGNLEPCKSAPFTISRDVQEMVFDNQPGRSGYVKAGREGGDALVGSGAHPAIGAAKDGKDCRVILGFDTAGLPDNVRLERAYLQIEQYAASGDVWSGARHIDLDVQRGNLGPGAAVHASDWGAAATAQQAARIGAFSSGVARSGDFSRAGLDAIDKAGITRIRLRMSRPLDVAGASLFIRGGAQAKLFVLYRPA